MALLLWRKKPSNEAAVQHLVYLLVLVTVILIGRVTLPYSSLRDYPSLRLLPDVILFLTGPAVFFFIRTLLHRGLPSGRRYWRHFIPAFIHVFIINTIVALHAEGLVDFLTRRQIIVLFYFVEVAAMFHLLAYLIGSVRFFRTYRREFYEKYAAEFIGEALLPHCIASFVILGLWIGGAFYGLVTSQPSYISYVLVWFALVFSVYFLAFRILLSTELLDLPPLLITSPSPSLAVPPETSAPPSQELDELDQYMLKHKPFLHPEIKIGDLASQLDLPRSELSRRINQGYQKNFFDFINTYRVREFIQLRQQPDYAQRNTLELAFQAGFNSKSAFNRAFRKVTGQSPRNYFKNGDHSLPPGNA